MNWSKNASFADRLSAAAEAKKAQLERAAQARSEAESPAAIKRWMARDAVKVARDARIAELCEVHFALGPKGPAKSWTLRSVADAKRSATRNSSGASCYQAPSWLVDDKLYLGSPSNAVK